MSAPCVVTTKRLPATNTKPTRYKATTAFGDSITVSYASNGNIEGHRDAFRALCKQMKWNASPAEQWAEGFQDVHDQFRVFVPIK